jgi:hypothetical protein
LLVPVLLPVEPLVLPEPVALGELLEELGELDEDELPEPVAPEDELPLMPEDELPLEDGEADEPLEPLELELKCLSHSEREIEPSLLVSTDEKLGWLMPELALPPAAPVDDDEPLADGEADEPLEALSPAAMARDDRAKSAAAVVTVTVFSIWGLL